MSTYNLYLKKNNKTDFLRQNLSVFSKKTLGYTSVSNGFIVTTNHNDASLGGVFTEAGELVDVSGLHEGKGRNFHFDVDRYDKSTIVFIGYIIPIWGHLITDGLKKLWFLDSNIFRQLQQEYPNIKLGFITSGNRPLPTYAKDLFHVAGLNLNDCIHIKEVVQYERIIIPDNSLFISKGNRFYTKEYKETIERIKHNVLTHQKSIKLDDIQKIYLTRTQLKKESDYNEVSIQELFSKRGYRVIAPERHSVCEQIYMYMNCQRMAVTEGSISHNCVFMSKGTTLDLIRKADYWNSYQFVANDLPDITVNLIDAHKSTKINKQTPWEGPFFLCITKQFEAFWGEHIPRFPTFLSLSWYHYLTFYYYHRIRKSLKLRTRLNVFVSYVYDFADEIVRKH